MTTREIQKGVLSPEVRDQYPAGDSLLKWVDAYRSASGDARKFWLGANKTMMPMAWAEPDSDDDEEEEE